MTRPNTSATHGPDRHENPVEGVVGVANVISGPVRLREWIRAAFAATLGTLTGVSGLQMFRLARVVDSEAATFVSVTVWDGIADFECWRASAAFVAAHPDRAVHGQDFQDLRSVRVDVAVNSDAASADVGSEVMRAVSARLPELVPADGQLVQELGWSRDPHRTSTLRKGWIPAIACTATFLDSAVVNGERE